MTIHDSRPRWGLVIIFLLVLGSLAAAPFLLLRKPAKDLPSYKVQNFVGTVEIYSPAHKKWAAAQRGKTLGAGNKIRTAPESEIDLYVPDEIRIRIKGNSEVEIRKPGVFNSSAAPYPLHLVKGDLLGSTSKKFEGHQLKITTPVSSTAIEGTTFQIHVNPNTEESSVRVLEGTATVKALKGGKSVTVKPLEGTSIKKKGPPQQPVKVSSKEWKQLKEGYELFERSAALEAKQLDLSKRAGALFQEVFDHGSFYTPNFGFADREFFQEDGKEESYMKISYDVFPAGSFVGAYLKIRGVDLKNYGGLQFEARVSEPEGFPDSMRIELKNESGIMRAYVPRDFKATWQTYPYPFRFTKPGPLTEMTFVFSNLKVGQHKKGTLYLKNFTLLPPAEPAARVSPAVESVQAAVPAPSAKTANASLPA